MNRLEPMYSSTKPSRRLPDGLVGRDVELALLRDALVALRAHAGRTVLVEGEAGIGKSALLDTALSVAETDGCQVLRGGCDALTQRFPLSAMMLAVGISALPTDGAGMEAGAAPSLVPDDPVTAALEHLVSSVERSCAESPVVLVLEDLHWADKASLLCWQRLSRLAERIPLLLIGTRRPLPSADPPQQHPELLRHDVRGHGGVVVDLTELPPDDAAAMAADLLRAVPGKSVLDRLSGAAGNPFYIRELLDAAVRSGAVRITDGVAELEEQSAQPGRSGQSRQSGGGAATRAALRDSILGRLDFLSPDALTVLRAAALLGSEFSISDLSTITERTPVALVAVVDDAITTGLLEAVGPRLRFRHALLSQALRDAMPGALRDALHRQAARSLHTARAPVERIAQQLLMTTETAESWEIDWLVADADPLSRMVPPVAAELLQRALGHLPRADARRAVLEDQLAETLFVMGRYRQVEQIARAIRHDTTDPERRAKAAWLLGYALRLTRRTGEALVFLEGEAACPDTPALWRARIGAIHAIVLEGIGHQRERARRAAIEALEAGRRLGDVTTKAYALHVRSIQLSRDDDLVGSLRLIDQALPLTSEHRLLADLNMLLHVNRQGISLELGLLREASAAARRILARNELSGSPRLGTLRMQTGLIAYELGEWDEAAAHLAAVTEIEHNREDELHALRALIAGHRDDWSAASGHLAALRRVTDAYGSGPDRPASHHGPLVLSAWALDAERAGGTPRRETALRIWLELGVGNRDQLRYKMLPTIVRLALADGDSSTANAAAQAARSEAELAPSERAQAVWHWCDGLVRKDPEKVVTAVDAFRAMGLALSEANAVEDAAVLTADAGAAAAARTLLDEAMRIYTRLDARWDARRAAARLRPLGIRPGAHGPRRRPATGWAALTATQRKVAELVAVGHPNSEIAAQLFISRRTVESHVSSILAKLQVNSRWEVKLPAER